MTRPPPLARVPRRWHKRLGLFAALFFAFLAVTGLLLNHGDSLALDAKRLDTPWLMTWYGLRPSVPEQGFRQEGLLMAWQEETWVLDGKPIKPGRGSPVGAVRQADKIWIATAEELSLLDPGGSLVDRIDRSVLPGLPIRRVGGSADRLFIDVPNGVFATADGLDWIPAPGNAKVNWARVQPLSDEQRQVLAPLFAPSLPMQRVLADIHSGRIFGRYGVVATDALALILLTLAASGVWMHWKSRPGSRRHAGTAGNGEPPSGHPQNS